MSVAILHDPTLEYACLYCNTSDWAFGPLLFDSREHAVDFLKWLGEKSLSDVTALDVKPIPSPYDAGNRHQDPRVYTDEDTTKLFVAWSEERTNDEGDLK